ncbi:hypothetical protein HanIR_Chr06g0275891 [Helianthus annuus]|nr:hypothetical protein HanIR_Chr06g0275891 [Helianthus annuus]
MLHIELYATCRVTPCVAYRVIPQIHQNNQNKILMRYICCVYSVYLYTQRI